MDSDRIKGKLKEVEGEAQQEWGKLKDKARDAVDDLDERFDRDDEEPDAERLDDAATRRRS